MGIVKATRIRDVIPTISNADIQFADGLSVYMRYRLFDKAEVSALLVEAGFTVRAIYGDYNGSPLTKESPIMVLIGQR